MTHFRVRQLDWKQVPDGFVAQTILGPIAIKVEGDNVTYETWFFDKPRRYEAASIAHAKVEARSKFLAELRPALEITYDSEEATEILGQSERTESDPPAIRDWDNR